METKSILKLKEGDAAPDFALRGIDDKEHSLKDYGGKEAIMIVFMCNHCPYVIAKTEIMNQLFEKYSSKGVAIIGINSNDAKSYPDDSFENMKKFAAEKKLKFDYLVDETQEVAKAYGAACTPDPFLFDKNFHLVYRGRFDDALAPTASVTTKDMEEAIEAVLSGNRPKQFFLPSIGCSIKWKKE